MTFWLETERTGTCEFCCWLCLSLGKSTCSSFYWSVNTAEILSPTAVGDCSVCQIYWHPQTWCFLEGKNGFGKWVCVFGILSPKLAEAVWEKTLLSKTGRSRLLTSDISQRWLIFKCCAWFQLHFFPHFTLSGWVAESILPQPSPRCAFPLQKDADLQRKLVSLPFLFKKMWKKRGETSKHG